MSNFTNKYLKYKNKYLHLKNQIGGKRFCEKAYKNILGTCWAVAIQTMLTFSDFTSKDLKRVMESINLNFDNLSFDDIKEKKKKFIDNKIEEVRVSKVLNSFYRLYNEYYPDYFYKGIKKEYLKKILNKFIDRYYSKVLEFNNSQKLEEIYDKTNPERCELVIAQNFKKLFEYSLLKNKDYGGNIITEYLFLNLLSVFFLNYKVSIKSYYDNFNSINFDRENDIGIIIHIEGHACCLYICGGQQKYYNDVDKKVYNCEWIDLLKTPNDLYIEIRENFRLIDYNTYENKHKLKKVKTLIVVSKHTRDSDLDLEIKKILNFTEFNPSDFKDRTIQSALGLIYLNNDLGVAQNWAMAEQWFRLAATQGDLNAMINLGSILLVGRDGVKQDKQEAMRLYRLASNKGSGEASLILGDIFYNDDENDVVEKKKEAILLYRLAAEQANTAAQFKLANILLNDKNIEEAKKWLRIAAEHGNLDAQFNLGDMYYKGEIFAKDDYLAEFWYKVAVDNGHVEAKFKLGDFYNSVESKERALQMYRDAAQYEHADAQFKLGEMYDNGEVEKIERKFFLDSIFYNYKKTIAEHKLKAEQLYKLAAKQGHIEAQKKIDVVNFNKELELANKGDVAAQNNLGIMFLNGTGVAKDYKEAEKFFRLAVEQGHPDAQYNLGIMLLNGIVSEKNYKEAEKFFRLAVEKGHPDAQYNLGIMYENGLGVTNDYKEAERLYRLATKQGHVEAKKKLDVIIYNKELKLAQKGDILAQYNLGLIYEHGQGVAQNNEEAVRWYRLAATQQYADAQFNLGYMYENGLGVTRDDNEAERLYRLAAEQGHHNAIINLLSRNPPKMHHAVQLNGSK